MEILDDATLHKSKRGIFAIDSTTFLLALTCLESFPYRKRKAAAKAHMRLRVGSFIPSVVRIESGRPQDCTMADELTRGMQAGDILLADRGYTDFGFLHNLSARKVFWVLRQKADMFHEIVGRRDVKGEILADEEVRLKAWTTHLKYPEAFRRVHARVEVDGKTVEMTFLTNNMKWEARTICELYRARWAIEVFFKELKQTLQFSDFIGTNTNAVLPARRSREVRPMGGLRHRRIPEAPWDSRSAGKTSTVLQAAVSGWIRTRRRGTYGIVHC